MVQVGRHESGGPEDPGEHQRAQREDHGLGGGPYPGEHPRAARTRDHRVGHDRVREHRVLQQLQPGVTYADDKDAGIGPRRAERRGGDEADAAHEEHEGRGDHGTALVQSPGNAYPHRHGDDDRPDQEDEQRSHRTGVAERVSREVRRAGQQQANPQHLGAAEDEQPAKRHVRADHGELRPQRRLRLLVRDHGRTRGPGEGREHRKRQHTRHGDPHRPVTGHATDGVRDRRGHRAGDQDRHTQEDHPPRQQRRLLVVISGHLGRHRLVRHLEQREGRRGEQERHADEKPRRRAVQRRTREGEREKQRQRHRTGQQPRPARTEAGPGPVGCPPHHGIDDQVPRLGDENGEPRDQRADAEHVSEVVEEQQAGHGGEGAGAERTQPVADPDRSRYPGRRHASLDRADTLRR